MKIIFKSKYLFPIIKINANCPKSEKNGTGPGSCGGNQNKDNLLESSSISKSTIIDKSTYDKKIKLLSSKLKVANDALIKAAKKGGTEKIYAEIAVKDLVFDIKKLQNVGPDAKVNTEKNSYTGYKIDYNSENKDGLEESVIKGALDRASYPLDLVSKKDKQILATYTKDGYKEINKYIRNKSELNTELQTKVDKLDKLFENSELRDNIVTYRGVSNHFIENNKIFDNPGSEIELISFTSTSIDPYQASKFARDGGRMFEIQLPAGTKALYLGNENSQLGHEKELIVNRNTKYEVGETRIADVMFLGKPTTFKITTLKAIL